ncbi:EF-P lysine aminoacylase EpmA [Methylococcus sp. EFPC2]|uniref:EF-P lysine aminoacylase EpmA n=1 Tax=Methylococcus sp. EFPC2 TaxID=2812648 RepID=UPI00196896CF|nr:EF-P lysine aminoacylase EpmA [Methylococcus sp. EFPC2]QSA95464.1 EF-P lysine aminoacylase GenX [Methylococcus sp. EFPC2]
MSRNKADTDWRPTCDSTTLLARAALLRAVRRYFDERGVLEVETPLLCRATGTDPHLQPFATRFQLPGVSAGMTLHLQTSPEFAMKRLLAGGSGSIYQICKAFRNEESGRWHNPEFSLLEWYRVGYSLAQLMDEIDGLLGLLFSELNLGTSIRIAYRDLFAEYAGIDPLNPDLAGLARCAERHGLPEAAALCGEDRSLWLDLLFSHIVQPAMEAGRLYFVRDYPAFLPSLARRKPDEPEVVERVEVFLNGVELGNGFHELADADEQERRFDEDLAQRRKLSLPEPEKDHRLLSALEAGLPDCSGVALGLDRILMLMTGRQHIAEVLAFPVARA